MLRHRSYNPVRKGIPHEYSDPCPSCRYRRGNPRPVDRLAAGRTPAGGRQGRRRRYPCARQERHRRRRQRHRLRRGPQQLFPARDARADGAQRGCLGNRPEGLQLPSRRLHAGQPRGHARGCDEHLRTAEGDRLPLGIHRGREGLHDLYEGSAVRLAGRRHHLRPAREERRLRQTIPPPSTASPARRRPRASVS